MKVIKVLPKERQGNGGVNKTRREMVEDSIQFPMFC
jgi:hypothetical protein